MKLSRRLWCGGHSADAAKAGQASVHLLQDLPPGPELAQAYSVISAIHLNDERLQQTRVWAERALELADTLGDQAVIVHSLNNLGTIQLLSDMPEGADRLARSLALAERLGLADQIGRAFIHAGWAMTRTRAYGLAPWLERGIRRCEELGLESWRLYLVAYRARVHLDQGRWRDADDDAALVLRSARSVPLLRILGLTVCGLVRARCGDPRQWSPLDEALTLLDGQTELQYHLPVASARAEAAWLSGRRESIDGTTRHALTLATERQATWAIGELAWWRRLAGIGEQVSGASEPYAAQLANAEDTAAEIWHRHGCPYDAALAMVESDDESRLRQALAQLQRLGAGPAAAIVARRLRERGARGLPRGPRPQTRNDPAHLTRREVEVLELIHHGASNAEIATRLHISQKTVHHHVSAVLRKLGVDSRGQAAFEAGRRHLVAGPPPQDPRGTP
jgi:DNA-binding CsgD family transcriptional regulator